MDIRRYRRGIVAVIAVGAMIALGACGGTGTKAENSATPTTAKQSATALTIPAPVGAPVVTITGEVGPGNQGSAVVLDQAAANSLNKIKLTVFDPFAKKTLTFKGVWLADLMRAAKMTGTAKILHVTALDDYVVDLTVAELRAGGIFLAVQNGDGSALEIKNGGPTRVVFRDGTAAGKDPERWIWSIATIEVR